MKIYPTPPKEENDDNLKNYIIICFSILHVIESPMASAFDYVFSYSTWRAFIVMCSFYFHLEQNLKNVTHIYLVYIF